MFVQDAGWHHRKTAVSDTERQLSVRMADEASPVHALARQMLS